MPTHMSKRACTHVLNTGLVLEDEHVYAHVYTHVLSACLHTFLKHIS